MAFSRGQVLARVDGDGAGDLVRITALRHGPIEYAEVESASGTGTRKAVPIVVLERDYVTRGPR